MLAANPAVFAAIAALFGLAIGSFLNVVIYRLPLILERQWRAQCAEITGLPAKAEGEPISLSRPRSRCPSCAAQIRAIHNIPVLSYLALRGCCASCGVKIPLRYPLVELATAIVSGVVAWHFGFGCQAALALVFSWYLIAMTGIDLDRQLLPDLLTLPLLWIGLLASLWPTAGFTSPRDALIGAAAGYLVLWIVFHAFRLVTGKEGMGYGDFKLFAAIGAWLGWQMLPLVLLLSAMVGAAVGITLIVTRRHGRDVPISFGPYLAGAGWIAMLWGPLIVGRYLGIAGLH
ncbi:MAG: Type 4 prepilin-like protein leader peptide-processing enzyme [Steroidobacteraceae bacterium]|nr:Type 4 prepilin-like protein leader peptide-processing enzyme [Steroidobacteraceae bacterium]